MLIYCSKGLKPLIVKYLVILLGICYLIAPYSNEISTVTHHITHTFTIPNGVLQHTSHDYEKPVVHQQHQHENSENEHEHIFIDFLTTFFNATDDNNHPEDSLLLTLTLDKHINNQLHKSLPLLNVFFKHRFLEPPYYVRKDYENSIEKPPKTLRT